jgi:repressor LexA
MAKKTCNLCSIVSAHIQLKPSRSPPRVALEQRPPSVAAIFLLTAKPYNCTVLAIMNDPLQLTPRQKQIVEYIQDETDERHRPPTVREIGDRFGMSSPGTVHDHLVALENNKWIERGHGKSRSIRLLKRLDRVPIVGEVTAGVPVLANEEHMGFMTLSEVFGSGDLSAVRVCGESMIDCGILDGDHAVVRRQPVVESGEIALVVLNGESTIKRLIKTQAGFRLQPENPAFAPIDVPEGTNDFRVAGKVVGILRKVERD